MKLLKSIALAALLWCLAGSVVTHAAQAAIELSSDRFVQQVDQDDASRKQLLAQLNLLTGAGGKFKAASAALPAPTFVAGGTLANSSGTWTSATVNIGNPAYIGTRRVIVMAASANSAGRTIVSGAGTVINTVQATVHMDSTRSGTEWVGCISAVVPSGTTNVTVTFTMSNTLFATALYAVYIVDESTLLSNVPTVGTAATTAGGTSLAPTISQTINGFVLGATSWSNGSAKTGSSSGSPDAVTQNFSDGANYIFASNLTASATTTETVTTSWTGSFSAISQLIAWR